MASVSPILIGSGILPGPTFALGHLVYVSAVGPPAQLSSYAPVRALDGAVEYTGVPNSALVYPAVVGATETFRLRGGLITEGAGSDSVIIGRGAAGSGTDTIAIGSDAVSTTSQSTVIGANARDNGQQAVVIGFNAGVTASAGVAIGNGASLSGNAGGNSGVAIGQAATASFASGLSGPVVIGLNATARSDDVVIGANASSNQSSVFGVGNTVIGSSAHANIGQGFCTVIGYTAAADVPEVVAVGAGATSATTRSIVIGNGSSTSAAGTQSIVIGYISAAQAAANIILGGGLTSTIANAAWIGSPNIDIRTIIFGAGNTIAAPAARTIRFTNASGADNAAGSITIIGPLATGSAQGGRIIFQTGPAGASSSTLQTATTAMLIGTDQAVNAGPGANLFDAAPYNEAGDGFRGSTRFKVFRAAGPPRFIVNRVNGTLAAPTVIVNNDQIGAFEWRGYDGTDFFTGSSALATATENWSGTAHGSNLGLYTTANGGTSTTAKILVSGVGTVTLQNVSANTTQVSAGGGTLNGANAQTFWDHTGTWNTSGVPTAFRVAITNTAVGAGALLMNLLAGAGGATSMFSVSSAGALASAGGYIAALGDVTVTNGHFTISANTKGIVQNRWRIVDGGSDGTINMTNNAATAGVCWNVATDAVAKLRTRGDGAYATLDVLGLKASGTPGANFGPGLPTSITVVNGIITAIS